MLGSMGQFDGVAANAIMRPLWSARLSSEAHPASAVFIPF